jgi:hypothetical protein
VYKLKPHKTVEQIAKKHRLDVSFVKKQLDMGIPIEHEHTGDKVLATDIALQHLDEIPDYYTRLKKMESSAKKEHTKFKDFHEHCGCEDNAVKELENGLEALSNTSYHSIDKLMRRIMKKHDMTAKQLHNAFVSKHDKTPDTWIKEKSTMKESKKSLRTSNPCWKGYKPVGTKKKRGRTVPNCVPIEEASGMVRYCPKCQKDETANECKYGPAYWGAFSLPSRLSDIALSTPTQEPNGPHPGNFPESYDHEYSMARSELSTIVSAAKRLRKKMKGEGNIEAWVQSKITKAADYLDTAADYVDSGEMKEGISFEVGHTPDDARKAIRDDKLRKRAQSGQEGADIARKKLTGIELPLANSYEPEGDLVEYSNWRADFGLSEDWQKVNRKDKTDGLSPAAVKAYRREHPGSKLQTAVTEKNPKGKRKKRRSNFCSRMSGMKSKLTSAKTARDPDSRINKALRRWRCEEFIPESVNISGDFNGNLYMNAQQSETTSESFLADVVWEGKIYRLQVEGRMLDKTKLTEQLQNEYPGAIVHNIYPNIDSSIKIKSSQRYRPESLTWSD